MNKYVIQNKDGSYCNAFCKEIMKRIEKGPKTVLQLLMNNVKEDATRAFIGKIIDNKVEYMSYKEVEISVKKLGGYLEEKISQGMNPIIGIYSINRIEWIISEFASYYANRVNCPLFSNFGNEALSAIFEETEMNILIASNSKARSLLESGVLENSQIKLVVLMDDDEELRVELLNKGIEVEGLKKILEEEIREMSRPEPKGEDLATICYTSGTSGLPKGVELTHKNIVTNVLSLCYNEDYTLFPNLSPEMVYISYLPLPHVLERICFLTALSLKAKICFYRGNPKMLQDDLKIIKPTFIVTVPRVLNLFAAKIKDTVAKRNWAVRMLFNIGVKWKIWKQKKGWNGCFIFDKIIFGKIAREFGGNLNASLCGGAPLDPHVQEFLQATMCMKIFQGYGQTEGFAANIVMPISANDTDSIGVPFPPCTVKLVHVNEFVSRETNAIGEIRLKGDNITRGYFKRQEETNKIFDSEGWLKTGDVAVERNGMFYIVGRIKDIFKTSFGEYIIPERVELAFCTCKDIEDIFVTTNKYSNFLVAIVVCTNKNIFDQEVIIKCTEFSQNLLKNKKLKAFEIPDRFIVTHKNFIDIENEDLITPSMKKKRNQLAKYFEKEISKAYLNK